MCGGNVRNVAIGLSISRASRIANKIYSPHKRVQRSAPYSVGKKDTDYKLYINIYLLAVGTDINASWRDSRSSYLLPLDQYYLPTEIAIHNSPKDCWVSFLGRVYDITELCDVWSTSDSLKPILAHAGKDISHWFDHRTDDIRHHVHPVTGVSVPYCPHGPIPDVNSFAPATAWRPLDRCPWWLEERYRIGNLTRNPRPCRVVNVLAGIQSFITVCEEDSIDRIQERYLGFNAHGGSYTWKFEGKNIDPYSTMTENGIPDERDRFTACGLSDDFYIPSLLCYYNDDLTEA